MEVFNKSPADWTLSGQDDLAVCPIGLDPGAVRFTSVCLKEPWRESEFLTPELRDDRRIGIGDTVFIVGRFVNHEGKQKNTPSVRFGQISMMPDEPVDSPFSGKPQECFLVDAKTRCGYSGSPAFVYFSRESYRQDYDPQHPIYSAAPWASWLLGIEWGQIPEPIKVSTSPSKGSKSMKGKEQAEEGYISVGTGMAGVIPRGSASPVA
jgi:hypothetical protein